MDPTAGICAVQCCVGIVCSVNVKYMELLYVRRSRVNQEGWNDVCGKAYQNIQKLPVDPHDLMRNLEDIRLKARDILKV